MVDGVLITDNHGEVRLINPAAAKLFNIAESSSALGHSFAEVVRHHQLIDLWQRCQTEGQEVTAAAEISRDLFLQVIVTPVCRRGSTRPSGDLARFNHGAPFANGTARLCE